MSSPNQTTPFPKTSPTLVILNVSYSALSTIIDSIATSTEPVALNSTLNSTSLQVSNTTRPIDTNSNQINPINSTNESTTLPPICRENPDILYIRLGISLAMLVLLFFIFCTSFIFSIYYCCTHTHRRRLFSQVLVRRRTDKSSVESPTPYEFRKLSTTSPVADSSIQTGEGTFSAHMAPPSPRSPVSNFVGMNAPEEVAVKKMALDRIEQEEAKRHTDLMLMSGSPTSDSESRSRSRSRTKSNKSDKITKTLQAPPAVTKVRNPSFVVDKKTNKLMRIDLPGLKNSTQNNSTSPLNKPNVKGAVNIPFKF